MIQYTLKCGKGHSFDSWFKSASSFEALKQAGHLECAVCGARDVEKAIMAPRVTASRDKAAAPVPANVPPAQPPAEPVAMPGSPEMAEALVEMRKHVEANSDYVGTNFAKEARDMHLGDAPERSIYGEAAPAEAKALIEDGVPVMPLPFTPTRKTN